MDWDEVIAIEYRQACRATQRQMPPWLRRTMVAEDIVHDAIVSLLEGHGNPRYLRIAVHRQFISRCREKGTLKRGGRMDQGDMDLARLIPGPPIGPGAALEFEELLGVVVDRAGSQRGRIMVRLLAEGLTAPEVATELHCSRRTVERLINKVGRATP